jgi:hypothetical protein
MTAFVSTARIERGKSERARSDKGGGDAIEREKKPKAHEDLASPHSL